MTKTKEIANNRNVVSDEYESSQRDSNPWPPPYQGDALPPEP